MQGGVESKEMLKNILWITCSFKWIYHVYKNILVIKTDQIAGNTEHDTSICDSKEKAFKKNCNLSDRGLEHEKWCDISFEETKIMILQNSRASSNFSGNFSGNTVSPKTTFMKMGVNFNFDVR